MNFFGIGGWEVLLIVIVGIIVFGPGKIPEIARNIGKFTRAIKKTASEFTSAMNKEVEAEEKAASELKDNLSDIQKKVQSPYNLYETEKTTTPK